MLDLILQLFSLMLDLILQLFSLMFDLISQLFSLMLHKNASDKFSFESCKFTIQRSKESTGRWSNIAITMVNQEKTGRLKFSAEQWLFFRVVFWSMGIMNSFTLEVFLIWKIQHYVPKGFIRRVKPWLSRFHPFQQRWLWGSKYFIFFIKKHSWCWFSYCSRVLADTFVRHCSTTGSPVITL